VGVFGLFIRSRRKKNLLKKGGDGLILAEETNEEMISKP
jgi:hypothetical protein